MTRYVYVITYARPIIDSSVWVMYCLWWRNCRTTTTPPPPPSPFSLDWVRSGLVTVNILPTPPPFSLKPALSKDVPIWGEGEGVGWRGQPLPLSPWSRYHQKMFRFEEKVGGKGVEFSILVFNCYMLKRYKALNAIYYKALNAKR